MTLEDAIHQANIILPEHKEAFIKQLKKFPYGIEKWLYHDSLVVPYSLHQGDILLNLPTCFIDEDGDIVEGRDFVALISNTCDMQPGRRDFVIISPIVSFDEYKEHLIVHTKKDVENVLMDIQKNRIFSFFYLPLKGTLPESFIDFSRMVSISSTYVNNIKNSLPEKCLLSLSPYGFYLFLIKLTFHLARMETPTVNR